MKLTYIPFLSGVLMLGAGIACAADTKVRILQDRTYPAEEVADVRNGETWTAITESGGKHMARNIAVSLKTAKLELADADEGPFTGKAVSAYPAGALFLIRGLPIKDGPLAEPVIHHNDALLASVTSAGAGEGVLLEAEHAKGAVKLVRKKQYSDLWKTEVYRVIALAGDQESLLTEAEFYGLVLASDLNHDGYPDFILSISTDSAIGPALFLSRVNKAGVRYYKAAEDLFSGC